MSHLTLGSMNQEAYFSIYKIMKGYNQQKPFHEDTGKLYSKKEREEFQKNNIEILETMAEEQNLATHLKFQLKGNLVIRMYAHDRIYNTERVR